MSRITVVIRCFNEEQHIGRLLEGLVRQSVPADEILLVDSGSTDATLAIASRYPVQVLSLRPEEFSFGRSLNVGCRAATGDLLVFASAHVYPLCHDWLERLVAPFENADIALAYGKQCGNEVSKYSERRIFARWFPDRSNPDQRHPFCNNANAAIRRSLWDRWSYDETLTGLEDLDWARRALAAGYRLAYVADAEVVHVHDETPGRIYNRYRREAIALKRIFPHEHFTLWDFCWLLTANSFSDGFHAWHDGVFLQQLPGILTFRLMQFWGTFRGFAQHGPVTSELQRTFYYPSQLVRPAGPSAASESERRIVYDCPQADLTHDRDH